MRKIKKEIRDRLMGYTSWVHRRGVQPSLEGFTAALKRDGWELDLETVGWLLSELGVCFQNKTVLFGYY